MLPRRARRVRPERIRRRGVRASLVRTLVVGATALITAVAGTGTAWAEPSPAELERQIDQAWNELEPTIEQYNQIHAELTQNRTKAAQLQQRLQPLQAQIDAAMGHVSSLAVQEFKAGRLGTVNAVLEADAEDNLLNNLALLDAIARNQRIQLKSVAAARDKYAADKSALDELIGQQAGQDAELAAKKTQIEAKLADLQRLRQQAYGSTGSTGALKPVACPVDYLGGAGGTAAKKACSLIGKPYIWGAAGPDGYDCSGLTLTAWAAAGVTLRHYTKWQWEDTTPVSKADLRPGDLVFFYSDLHHMGIYVGGGWMVHAPHTGDQVRMAKLEGRPITGYRRPG